jgi:hypothetical protein
MQATRYERAFDAGGFAALAQSAGDGIRLLFAYAQLLLSISTNDATYGTTATEPSFGRNGKKNSRTKRKSQRFRQPLKPLKINLYRKIKNRSFSVNATAMCSSILKRSANPFKP